MINPFLRLIFLFGITFFPSCKEDTKTAELINAGNDLNFTIVAHSDNGFSSFNRKVVVFGIDIYAVSSVEDTKLLHTGHRQARPDGTRLAPRVHHRHQREPAVRRAQQRGAGGRRPAAAAAPAARRGRPRAACRGYGGWVRGWV